MAGICQGKWLRSKIKNVDDGTIDIKQATGGILTGKHNDSQRNVIGQCTGGAIPHITFTRMADGCFYIYDGDIERVTVPVKKLVIRDGSVTVVCGPFKTKRSSITADDWTAEKPT